MCVIKCGMPQGTLLDPLLSLTYISDIQYVCHNIDIDRSCCLQMTPSAGLTYATSPALTAHASVIDLLAKEGILVYVHENAYIRILPLKHQRILIV